MASKTGDETLNTLKRDLLSRFRSCRRAFLSIDVCRTGVIEIDELERILSIYNLPLDEVPAIFCKLDAKKMGVIDYEDFSREFYGSLAETGHVPDSDHVDLGEAMAAQDRVKERDAKVKAPHAHMGEHLHQQFAQARKAFLKMDLDRHGYISEDDIARFERAHNLPLENLLEQCDRDHDGKLSYAEVAKYLFEST